MDDILDVLVAHGVPGATIVRVAELIANAKVLQGQRDNARERMRDVRERRSRTFPNVQNGSEHETPSISKEVVIKKENKRGTRLPEGWQPDPEDCTYAIDHGLDPKAITVDFCDYWHARAGPGAIKVDWKATWRRWCRTASERQGGKPATRPTPVLDFAAGFDARTRMQLAERAEIERQRRR
jgi:hypothetical protein